MLWGAIVGLVVGLTIGIVRAVLSKGDPCPECDRVLPVPWFRPLRECPSCGASLAAATGGGRSRPSRTSKSVARSTNRTPLIISLIVSGIGLVVAVVFLPSMMENRRIWRYQQGRVDQLQREINKWEQDPNPAAQAQASQLKEKLRTSGWYPESYREGYQTKAFLVGLGGSGFVVGGALAVFLLTRRAANPAIRPRRRRDHDDFD